MQKLKAGFLKILNIIDKNKRYLFSLCAVFTFCALFLCSNLMAQSVSFDFNEGSVTSKTLQLLILITVLSLAPSILVMVTSFTRMIVVFSFLRTAIGMQQSPPNTVLASLALFLTFFVMSPTFEKSYEMGIKPMLEEKIKEEEALPLAAQPFKEFMLANVRKDDLGFMMQIGKVEKIEKAIDTPYRVLIPAFIISELRRAFEIGFLLFIPFVIIDMIVASILMSMGMMMLPPMMISLPFKVIFFVLVDGWTLITGSLVQGYSGGG